MPSKLQEQLIATRRQHILTAAAQVFAEKGFHATSIKDIARRAGVADGTIYNAFDNKEALLLGVFDQLTHSVAATIDPAMLTSLDLRGLLSLYFSHPLKAFQASNFELFRVVLSQVMVNPELAGRFQAQILQPMIQGGEALAAGWAAQHGVAFPRGGPDMRIVAGLIIGLLVQRVLGDETLAASWDALPGTLADLLLGGLAPHDV